MWNSNMTSVYLRRYECIRNLIYRTLLRLPLTPMCLAPCVLRLGNVCLSCYCCTFISWAAAVFCVCTVQGGAGWTTAGESTTGEELFESSNESCWFFCSIVRFFKYSHCNFDFCHLTFQFYGPKNKHYSCTAAQILRTQYKSKLK